MKALFVAIAIGVVLSSCAPKSIDDAIKTELPNKPLAAETPSEPLTEHQEQACLQEGPEARDICRKVEKNDTIAKGNQDFIERLYEGRDNK